MISSTSHTRDELEIRREEGRLKREDKERERVEKDRERLERDQVREEKDRLIDERRFRQENFQNMLQLKMIETLSGVPLPSVRNDLTTPAAQVEVVSEKHTDKSIKVVVNPSDEDSEPFPTLVQIEDFESLKDNLIEVLSLKKADIVQVIVNKNRILNCKTLINDHIYALTYKVKTNCVKVYLDTI